jgi:hypothetical protein
MSPKKNDEFVFIQEGKENQKFFNHAAKEVIDYYAPSYLLDKPFLFEAFGSDNKFYITDELDYVDLNSYIERANGNNSDITQASIANDLSSAKMNLLMGARYGFDISTGELSRKINELKLNTIPKG